ncbi:hypothetical protein K439DRAFT_1618487 [Ramaria rubella]|nr:hypothetical protein K439DRAFT_1618487 [Ramaria rubella]
MVAKDADSKLTIHDMTIYNRPIGMHKNPFEIQMLQAVAGMWSKVKHAKACSAKDNIQEHINRQHAMVAHGFAWDWVEHACVIKIKAIMTDPSNSCTPWIASLIRKVQSFIETHSAGQLELQGKDQLPFCEMEPMIATVMGPHTAGGHAPFLLDTDLKDYVLKEMISVITQWLQYPKEKTISAAQGKFVNMLLTITNSYDIFLLNATWKVYCFFPKSELFNDRKLKQITDNQIADTCDKFKESPIAQSGSREIQAIRDMAKMCQPFGAISKNSNPNTLATTVAEFVQFLRDLMPTTQSLISQSSDNNLICKVIKCPDFYMPFREIAPSRCQVTGPQGPFEHNFIRTRSGLFSTLIYRGITYTATAESDTHNNHFEYLNTYISYCRNNQFKGVDHFRNMTAYGTPNHK